MSDIVAKIIMKVYLVSGREITHTYELPTSKKEVPEFIKGLVWRAMALVRGEIKFLHFENPHTFYNIDNVEGIGISSIGVEELETLLRKAQSGIGFTKQ